MSSISSSSALGMDGVMAKGLAYMMSPVERPRDYFARGDRVAFWVEDDENILRMQRNTIGLGTVSQVESNGMLSITPDAAITAGDLPYRVYYQSCLVVPLDFMETLVHSMARLAGTPEAWLPLAMLWNWFERYGTLALQEPIGMQRFYRTRHNYQQLINIFRRSALGEQPMPVLAADRGAESGAIPTALSEILIAGDPAVLCVLNDNEPEGCSFEEVMYMGYDKVNGFWLFRTDMREDPLGKSQRAAELNSLSAIPWWNYMYFFKGDAAVVQLWLSHVEKVNVMGKMIAAEDFVAALVKSFQKIRPADCSQYFNCLRS